MKYLIELERKRIFLRFLKENNCLLQYMKNIRHNDNVFQYSIDNLHFNHIIKGSAFDCLLSTPFVWTKTDEGEEYWFNLHKSWERFVRKIEKTCNII